MRVIEYKVKASPKQLNAIAEAIKTVQFIRNKCIRFWIDSNREDKITGFALNKYSTQLRNEFKFVSELNSMAVQASAERAWFAISRFYENCKKKVSGKKGFPKFQKDNRSVEYKTSGWKLHPSKRRITITDKKGIGELKLLGTWDIHRYDKSQIKRVRLVKRSDGYYCQFCINTDTTDTLEPTGKEVGIDVGLEYFYTDSNGHQEPNPRFLRKSESILKHSQRRIYKKEKGSKNRIKARRRYSSKHLNISRQRNEHAKRIARNLCKSNDLVVYESLRVRNMVKNRKLAKSISDVSWRLFLDWIDYFSQKFGRVSIAVPPHYTSQNCSNCGNRVKKSLSQRTHICNRCGTILNRDLNAAINILNLGKQATGGHPESNALGVATSTLADENLLEQVATMSKESPVLEPGECQ